MELDEFFTIISTLSPIWLFLIAIFYPREGDVNKRKFLLSRSTIWIAVLIWGFIVPPILGVGNIGHPRIPTLTKLIYMFGAYLLLSIMLINTRYGISKWTWYFFGGLFLNFWVVIMWVSY